jgi:hypothetical protein
MLERVHETVIRLISQPIIKYLKNPKYENGKNLFKELFYNRVVNQQTIENVCSLRGNTIIKGNPGEGKSCLLHYMFDIAQQQSRVFPIMLDYKSAPPRTPEALLKEFVVRMREYLACISQNDPLTSETTLANFNDHFTEVQRALSSAPLDAIKKKRLVIFLDDFDYMDNGDLEYKKVLKTYFLPFLETERASILISGRRPLVDNLLHDPELKHAFRFQAKLVELDRMSLGDLLRHRFQKLSSESFFRKYVIKTLSKEQKEPEFALQSVLSEDILGFDDLFYSRLLDITGRNISLIEEIFPKLHSFQQKNRYETLNFKNDFFNSYIACTYEDDRQLLDIVSRKTNGKSKSQIGNSVFQIVLEYFYEHELADQYFYESMAKFGISKDHVEDALYSLSHEPYGLIDPHTLFIRSADFSGTHVREFEVNGKLRMYIQHIISSGLYYEKLTERMRMDNPGHAPVTRSARRLLERA